MLRRHRGSHRPGRRGAALLSRRRFNATGRSTAGLARRALGELVGTTILLTAVVGSGVAAQRLSPGDAGLQLLQNAAATAAALVAVIIAVGPVSGAHLNPVVTLADWCFAGIRTTEAGVYIGAQMAGAALGTVVANLMWSLPLAQLATTVRSSGALWFGEVVATFGLLLVVFGVARSGRSSLAPVAVGAYIGAAYFFTSSTSVANPAATAARILTDSFAGIAPSSAPAFVAAQLAGGALAVGVVKLLYPDVEGVAADVVVPHAGPSGPPGRPVPQARG